MTDLPEPKASLTRAQLTDGVRWTQPRPGYDGACRWRCITDRRKLALRSVLWRYCCEPCFFRAIADAMANAIDAAAQAAERESMESFRTR